jgi:hypothetical protein
MKKATKPIAPILPREKLTDKAKWAIERYAVERCDGLTIVHLLVHYTLQAERMRRTELYAWLEKRGYVWKQGLWHKPITKAKTVTK